MNELKKQCLDNFWSIYDSEGAIQALSWLESLKYYEEYCIDDDDISMITKKMEKL